MGYYNGSAMSMRGSYCIHYGVKGMKWYQNIFGGKDEATGQRARGLVSDLGQAIKTGYRGAERDVRTSNNRRNEYNKYISTYGPATNKYRENVDKLRFNNDFGSSSSFADYGKIHGIQNAKSASSDFGYDRAIGNIGSFVGTTAYNATVVAKKISDASKTAWSEVKRVAASAIGKGRRFIFDLFGINQKKFNERQASIADYNVNNSERKKKRDFESRQNSIADYNATRSAYSRLDSKYSGLAGRNRSRQVDNRRRGQANLADKR